MKKCPFFSASTRIQMGLIKLLQVINPDINAVEEYDARDCIGKECAVWDPVWGCCGLRGARDK